MLSQKKYQFLVYSFMFFTVLNLSANAQTDIKLMSFNIRLDTEADGENRWDKRKEQVAGLIRYYSPDFLGAQEVLHHQLTFLLQALPGYAHIGVARDDGKQEGEYSPVIYNAEKFKLIEEGTFWLSPTPDSVSFGWDAVCRRVCSYGIFEDKQSKQRVLVLNTHFDHVGTKARSASAKLILQKLTEINKRNYPVMLTGDLNATPEKEPIQLLKEELKNARTVSIEQPYGPVDTWNAFQYSKKAENCIDYIFVDKRKSVQVTKFITINQSYDMKYPSDHFPVMANLRIEKN